MSLASSTAGNQAVMSRALDFQQFTLNEALDLLSEGATEIENLTGKDNIVAQRMRQYVRFASDMESVLDRAIRVSAGGRVDASA